MRLNKYRTSPEKKRRLHQFPPVRRVLIGAAVVAVGLGAYGGWLWRDVIHARAVQLSAEAGLRIERIEIKGRLNTDKKALEQAIATPWYSPIYAADLDAIHERVTSLGWIKAARVERQLPATLIVTLEERVALALYQDDRGHHVIDRSGAVIEGVAVEAFTHLPVIKGRNAPAKAMAMIELLKQESDLFAQVWSLTYQSDRRWDVYLRNNIRVQLPEMEPGKAWSKLAAMDRTRHLTSRDIINIDLRIPEKLVIRSSHASQRGNNT